ncbi:MAG: PspC domain-containing protein [Candidatus Paceibacterota bacterium]|nr:MAG: PspC domain-containing protein [Candidatus Paceibacterota bacterium]
MNNHQPLRRSRVNKIFGGVAGGLGEYFDLDPVFIRLLFIILAVVGDFGFTILLYLALMFILPLQDAPQGRDETLKDRVHSFVDEVQSGAQDIADRLRSREREILKRRTLLGVGLIALGVLAFLREFFSLAWFQWSAIWPIVCVVVGVIILQREPRAPSAQHKEPESKEVVQESAPESSEAHHE